MPTVATLLAADKTGGVWLLDISFDDFQTVAYRWATASVRVDGNEYDGRIASVTPVVRGLGRDHLPAAATTKLRISNSDFGADWMTDRTTVATQLLKARFRLSAYLYDSRAYAAAAGSLSAASQPIGIFNCLQQPEQMDSAVDVTLADDSLGRLAEPLTTPTIRDWADAPTGVLQSADINPFRAYEEPLPAMDWDVPLPLVFGLGELNVNVPAYSAVAQYKDGNAIGQEVLEPSSVFQRGQTIPFKFPIVVCAAKAGNNNYRPADSEISKLWGTFKDEVYGKPGFAGVTIAIPRTVRTHLVALNSPLGQLSPAIDVDVEIWRPRRSPTITKMGRSWQVVWIEFNVDFYQWWFRKTFSTIEVLPNGGSVGGITEANAVPVAFDHGGGQNVDIQYNRGAMIQAFANFRCNGSPLSTVTTMDFDGRTIASNRLVDHMHDAIAYYSKATIADMDTDAWTRARAARNTVTGAGIIQPARPRPLASAPRDGWVSPSPRDGVVGVLRTALGDMCASCDADLFMTKSGLYSIITDVFDFEAVTEGRTDVVESRTQRVRIRTPTQGERWAPYNRVVITGPGGGGFGPFDNQDAIDEWGTVLPKTINGKWNARLWGDSRSLAAAFSQVTVWEYRNLESKVRPIVRFVTDREYLQLELGDYFTFNYTRGGQTAVFSGTIFRLESMRINPLTLAVELEAVWVDDLATDKPFLLDDEELITVVASTPGRTVNVQDSESVIEFIGGDLVADGVVEGDILILRDETQAESDFTRNRALRIAAVNPAGDAVTVEDDDLGFGAPSPLAVDTWEIRRGFTSYPTSASDPVNYPSGGTMYGKACNEDDEYSDATEANKLMGG